MYRVRERSGGAAHAYDGFYCSLCSIYLLGPSLRICRLFLEKSLKINCLVLYLNVYDFNLHKIQN